MASSSTPPSGTLVAGGSVDVVEVELLVLVAVVVVVVVVGTMILLPENTIINTRATSAKSQPTRPPGIS
jgi:hypothetical protein